MSSTPAVIVEGINDIKIYNSIAKSINRCVEVYAVEAIKGYSAGCGHVINAVKALYASAESVLVEDFVIGIIDRDTREFRGELPVEKAFLVLNYYSVESHFVDPEIVRKSISTYTLAGDDAVSEEMIDALFSKIEQKLYDLYYFSLESLRFALDGNYNSDYRYSFANNRRKQDPAMSNVRAKIHELDSFAASLNIRCSLSDLKKISTGKWLLGAFSEEIYILLTNFKIYCGKFGAKKCQYCKREILDTCTYKIKEGISNKTIYSLAFEHTGLTSLDYVRDRFSSVSAVQ